nr:glycosyltransferase [Vibrio sinus]
MFVPSLIVGGAEKVFVTLANRFAHEGLCVTLLTQGINNELRQEVNENVTVRSLNVRRSVYALPSLIRFFVTEKPDIFVSGLQMPNVISSLAHFMSCSRAKHIVTEHSNSASQLAEMPGWRRILMIRAIRWSYKRAAKVVAVSKGVKECLVTSYAIPCDQVKVIHNPINLALVRQRSQDSITHPWFTKTDIPVAVAVGRLTPAKNFSMLLDAMVAIHKMRPLRLVIVGEGALRSSLENKIERLGLSSQVMLLGSQTNPFPYIAQANLLAVSSSREGFSNVIVEALALGTPVVSTNCPSGPAEVLEEGEWGRLTAVDDPNALAEAMLDTLEEEKKVYYRRADAFSDISIAKQYIKLFFDD